MRQEQERFRQQFRSVDRGVATNPPLRWHQRWHHVDISGDYLSREPSREGMLQEIRFSLRQENNGDRREDGSRKPNLRKSDGFVPFMDEEPQEEYVFVNNYGGAYSQKMELNRRGG